SLEGKLICAGHGRVHLVPTRKSTRTTCGLPVVVFKIMSLSLKDLLEALPNADEGSVRCLFCRRNIANRRELELHLVSCVLGPYRECAECHRFTSFLDRAMHVYNCHRRWL
ncbi:hypothetical protein GCK32_000008, partial [Trichostrongylus colubriformis]